MKLFMRNLSLNKSLGACLALLLALAFVGCSVEAKRARHLKRAEEYFQKGDYIKAELEYRNVARLSKTADSNVTARVATIFYQQGRSAQSFNLLTNAVALNPNDLDLRYKLGTVWLAFRNYTNARSAALFILERKPHDPDAMLLLADAAGSKPEDIALARQKVNDLIKSKGETWSAHVALASLAIREKQLDLAGQELDAAAKLETNAPALNISRAQLASLRKQPQQAEQFLRAAVEKSSARSGNSLLLAQLKWEQTNLVEAKALLDKQIKEAPDYIPASLLRTKIALSEKDFTEADRLTKGILAWDPLNYDMGVMRARSLLLQGRTTNAVQEFERLLTRYDQVAELKYEAAVAHVQNGNVPEALKKLDEVTRQYPDYTEAVLLRAELKMRTGSPQDAVDSLVAFSRKHPDLARDDLTLAAAYRMQRKYDDALAVYRGLIRKYPSVAEFWYFEGATLLLQNKPDQARGSFEQALNLAPDYVLAAEQLVDLDLAKKNFDAAQRRADEQLKRTTNSPSALMLQAKVCFAKRDWAGAEAALNQVVKAQPDAMLPYSLLANIYLSTGDPKKALAQLQSALDKKPDDTTTLMLIATIQSALKNHSQAADAYQKILKVNPNMPAALNDYAYLLSEKLNKVDEALPLATRARELAPSDAGVADTLGWILYRRGELTRALPLLRESAEKLPKQAEVQYHFAMANYSAGDQAVARAGFARVAELDKSLAESRGVQRQLAILDLKIEQPNAEPTLDAALKENSSDFFAAVKLGQVYERAGANDKARASWERAAKISPDSTLPHVLLASLHANKLNDLPKALEAARAARKLSPNDPAIAGLLGRISYRSRDYVAAAALLQEYARSQSADADAPFDLALASYAIGQFEDTRANLGKYIAAGQGAHIPEAKDVLTVVDFAAGQGDSSAAEKIAAQRVQRDANDLPGLMTLGLIAQQSGKHSDAAQRFERLVTLDRALLAAQRQLALLYAGPLRDFQKAYDYGTKARQAFPNDPELAIALGKTAYQRNDFPAAARYLSEAVVSAQSDAEAFYYLGMAYHRTGKSSDAKIQLNKAISGKLNPTLEAEAKKVLASLK